MSISYSSVVGFGSGKATLPSVETWGANMNILRDPPKSIFTRKIDRVGQTSEITEMIDNSGDRACEAIMVYGRGINPMVSVSYDNYGNNGGQKSGNLSQVGLNTNGGSSKQAYLPYRIMNAGAFRPPVRDQRELLPLSRLPRVWTSSFSQPSFPDFSKKAMCQTDNYREVKNEDQMLKACIRPTVSYQLETPIKENFEVKYVIKNPVQTKGFSGIQPCAKFNGEMGKVNKIIENPLQLDININKRGEVGKTGEINFSTKKYTQDALHSDVNTSLSRNSGTDMENINLNTERYTQDALHSDVNTSLSRNNNTTNLEDIHGIHIDKYTQDALHSDVNTSLSRNNNTTNLEDIHGIHIDKYTQNVLHSDVNANLSQKTDVRFLSDIHGLDVSRKIKDQFNIDYETPHTSYEKTNYEHKNRELQRILPYHESRTNSGYNIHKNIEAEKMGRTYSMNRPTTSIVSNIGTKNIQRDNLINRNFNLKPTISSGGMESLPTMPLVYHENNIQEFDSHKTDLRKNIYNLQQERNTFLGSVF